MGNQNSKETIKMLGERVRAYRIAYPMTQSQLAERSGVSTHSVHNFEHGGDLQLSNLIKILNALDLGDNLDVLVPDMSKRPSNYLEHEKKRMRAGKLQESKTPFKWGDEA